MNRLIIQSVDRPKVRKIMIANNITKDRYILEVTLEKALLIIPIVQA